MVPCGLFFCMGNPTIFRKMLIRVNGTRWSVFQVIPHFIKENHYYFWITPRITTNLHDFHFFHKFQWQKNHVDHVQEFYRNPSAKLYFSSFPWFQRKSTDWRITSFIRRNYIHFNGIRKISSYWRFSSIISRNSRKLPTIQRKSFEWKFTSIISCNSWD